MNILFIWHLLVYYIRILLIFKRTCVQCIAGTEEMTKTGGEDDRKEEWARNDKEGREEGGRRKIRGR